MTKKKFTASDRSKLADKLSRFGNELEPVEQAYLAGMLALGAREIQRKTGTAAIGEVTLEYDARHLPQLSQAIRTHVFH